MQNDEILPPAPRYETEEARADAVKLHRNGVVVPIPEDELEIFDVQQASEAHGAPEVSGDTVRNASDEAPAGNVPNDAELQLVLRNAHPFQDASLSLAQRVDAFKLFEKEVRDTQAYWKNRGDRPTCQECGKNHAPPHTTKEQQAAVGAAFKEGKRLRKELNRQLNNTPRSLSREVTMVDRDDVAPVVKKPKPVFCETCSKWHPGGKKECKAPLCPLGCGKHHMPEEDCDAAAKRFALVAAQRNPPKSTPSVATASDSSRMDALCTLLRGLPDNPATWGAVSTLVDTIAKEKRPETEPAENAGSSKRQKKKTGRGNSCQTQPQHPHKKGPPKPDDKGKGKATQA